MLVFVGGGLGAVLRAALIAATVPWAVAFPAGVFAANLLGSLLLGAVYVAADEARLLGPRMRLFLAVGVLGGFTTFSTFALGEDDLISSGMFGFASLYLGASVLGGVAAVVAGMTAMRLMLKKTHRVRK